MISPVTYLPSKQEQSKSYLIINTIHESEQECLITKTCPHTLEEETINQLISNGDNINDFLSFEYLSFYLKLIHFPE